MKLFSIFVLYKEHEKQVKLLKSASDLSSFGYFNQKNVFEFMKLTAKILTERIDTSSRASIKEQEYVAHVLVRYDNLTCVIISDQEYPKRVAHTLLNKILDDFSKAVSSNEWSSLTEEAADYTQLASLLAKYQNPKEADALMKLEVELDETKIILHNTIEAILQRGEKLDDVVSRSEDLSFQAKFLYNTAKKSNACCSYLA